MTQKETAPCFANKTLPIRDWLKMIQNGQIALPSYQRSYVWKDNKSKKMASYLQALLQGRPTGTFMVLKCEKGESLSNCRGFHGVANFDSTKVTDLLLDGQQRLTSLWKMLTKGDSKKFYVRVNGINQVNFALNASEIRVEAKDKAYPSAQEEYKMGCIPAHLLHHDNDKMLEEWCVQACGGDKAQTQPNMIDAMKAVHQLRDAIKKELCKPLSLYDVAYFELSSKMNQDEAINIFIATNNSVTKVSQFDIVAADIQDTKSLLIRNQIANFYHNSTHLKAYYPGAENEWIPEIGEWMFKVACLKAEPHGMLPAGSNYKMAIKKLLENRCNSTCKGNECQTGCKALEKALEAVLQNLEDTLDDAAQKYGGVTKRTIACIPPFHVLAALRDTIKQLSGERSEAKVKREHKKIMYDVSKLIDAYVWQSFFTNRYDNQANQSALADFQEIKICLDKIIGGEAYCLTDLTIFKNYVLPTTDELKNVDKPWGLISKGDQKGRKTRAVIAIAMCDGGLRDWGDGALLSATRIRELEPAKQLNLHHIFPQRLLAKTENKARSTRGNKRSLANHVLNCVCLQETTNKEFGYKDPSAYLNQLVAKNRSKKDIADWICSHLVPSSTHLWNKRGGIENRYRQFIEERAEMLVKEIHKKTSI